VRSVLGEDTPVSVTLNLHVTRAASDDPADVAAKHRIDTIANEVFLGPMLLGAYPEQVFADTAAISDWSFVQDGDLDLIRVPLTLLGVNYYATGLVRAGEPAAVTPGEPGPDGHRAAEHSPWVGADQVEWLPVAGPCTAMGWNIDPQGLVDLLLELRDRFPDQPLAITENGAAFVDEVSADGRVHDADRVAYLHDHIDAMGAAMDAGADVRGYFVWSLLDNFEWAYGFDRRFGVVRVDYDTLERTVKDSGRWYAELVRTGTVPPAEVAATL
jgi:beta-glucosidase